jgi:hypothetical protein
MVHLSFVIEMVWRCGGVRESDEVTVFVRLHNMLSGNFGCPHTTDNTVLAVFCAYYAMRQVRSLSTLS